MHVLLYSRCVYGNFFPTKIFKGSVTSEATRLRHGVIFDDFYTACLLPLAVRVGLFLNWSAFGETVAIKVWRRLLWDTV